MKAADPAKDARKRQKLTLRIPDDEVSRPQLPATTPMGGVPAVSASRPPSRPDYHEETAVMPVQPSRIISIGSADDTLELPAAELQARGGSLGDGAARRAPGIDDDARSGVDAVSADGRRRRCSGRGGQGRRQAS